MTTTQQSHARRRERVAIKAAMREVDPQEFGECALCGFTHSYPLERAVCLVCGGDVCRGEPVCGCGDGGGIRCYDGHAEGAARATAGPRGDTHIHVHGGASHGE
jgi:hypothetical protein